MPTDDETPNEKAIRLLKQQLDDLQTVGTLNHKDAKFKSWRDTTIRVLETFLGPKSRHTTRFSSIAFSKGIRLGPAGARPPDYVSQQDMFAFRRGCEMAEVALQSAIRGIEDGGLPEAQPEPAPAVTLHNQGIATNDATQNPEHICDDTGASLNRIAALLQQSDELTRRELKEVLAHIEAAALEVQKPEQTRDWKVLLECCQSILDLAAKATDMAKPLAPYTPAILAVMDQAKQALGLTHSPRDRAF